MNKLFFILAILLQLQSVLNAKTKFSDRQVATMIPKYFARDHNSPQITRKKVYAEDGKKVLHLDIEVNRNRFENQMEYALSAMSNIARYASRPDQEDVLLTIDYNTLNVTNTQLIVILM